MKHADQFVGDRARHCRHRRYEELVRVRHAGERHAYSHRALQRQAIGCRAAQGWKLRNESRQDVLKGLPTFSDTAILRRRGCIDVYNQIDGPVLEMPTARGETRKDSSLPILSHGDYDAPAVVDRTYEPVRQRLKLSAYFTKY
jgi:hypothetical protein